MGSKTGWIVAGVLVALLIVIFIWVSSSPSITPPTLEMGKTEFRIFQDVGVGVGEVTGYEPSGDGNAADDYNQAAKLADSAVGEMMTLPPGSAANPPASVVEKIKQVDTLLAAGARKKSCKYLFVYTPTKLEVGVSIKELRPLEQVSGAVQMLTDRLIQEKNLDQAWQVYEHALVFGRHLTNERSHLQIVKYGLGVQRMAIEGFQALRAGGFNADPRKVAGLDKYSRGFSEFERIYGQKHMFLWKLRPDPGNVFWVAQNDPDRTWRVLAVLTMGLVKYTSPNSADHKYTEKLLMRYCADGDPLIKAAAEAARDLTKDDLRTMATRD